MYYNDLIYASRPVKFKNYISNKYDLVHQQLYEDALKKYINEYISDIVFRNMLYELFNAFNNFLYIFDNDENEEKELINYENIFIYLKNRHGLVLTLDDINLHYLDFVSNDATQYYDNFIIYLKNQNSKIFDILQELGTTANYNKSLYIKYFLINILYTIKYTKIELYNVLVNSNVQSSLNLTSLFDISDFIIKYRNSVYVTGEDSYANDSENVTLFRDETLEENMPEYILIYDEVLKNQIHIGYSNDGRIILDIDSDVNVDDILGKLSKIMKTTNVNLKMLMANDMYESFLGTHKIIEIKADEYWKPSHIVIYNRIVPYTRTVVDLTPYWNMIQKYEEKKIDTVKMTNENILDSTVKSFDYVRGKAKMYSKINDMTYDLDFDYMDENTNIDEEMLTDTFTYKYNNL